MSSGGNFDATRWSLVRQAQGDSERSREALGDLCQAYWETVFRFLRCEGRSEDDARELAQAFFAKLLEGNAIAGADPDRGRFSSYVLGAVKHFLADRRKAAQREKRGGGQQHVPLDVARDSSSGLQVPDERALHDDTYFDREWANTVLARALTALEETWQANGKVEEFAVMITWLPGVSGRPDQEHAANELGMAVGAFKVAIHRLRKDFRDAVRAEIAQTVEGEAAVGEELRYLLAIVSR
ncbi:MAG: ECF-type sigma factor [Verrucomicrobiales bacterium]|nr:ECF-type sigma factor [Verrucomicrobiales bacterium]